MNAEKIEEIIKSKHTIYNLKVDQRKEKIGKGMKLEKVDDLYLPDYIVSQKNNFIKWFD